MPARFLPATLAFLFAVALPLRAEDADAKEKKKNEAELAKIDAEIKKKPDDPGAHTRRTQCLVKLARYDDAWTEAQKTIGLYAKAGDNTAFILLESVDLGSVVVEVRFNMGSRERKPPDIGIVRPVAFRVMSKDDKGKAKDELEVVNFELGYMGGKAETAAFGKEEAGGGHSNFGMAKTDDTYKTIREKGLELVGKRHPKEEKKGPDDKK